MRETQAKNQRNTRRNKERNRERDQAGFQRQTSLKLLSASTIGEEHEDERAENEKMKRFCFLLQLSRAPGGKVSQSATRQIERVASGRVGSGRVRLGWVGSSRVGSTSVFSLTVTRLMLWERQKSLLTLPFLAYPEKKVRVSTTVLSRYGLFL